MTCIRILSCAAALVAVVAAPPVRAADIMAEWGSVKLPPPPELKPVTLEGKTTALLILDVMKESCARRPRCRQVPGFAARTAPEGARDHQRHRHRHLGAGRRHRRRFRRRPARLQGDRAGGRLGLRRRLHGALCGLSPRQGRAGDRDREGDAHAHRHDQVLISVNSFSVGWAKARVRGLTPHEVARARRAHAVWNLHSCRVGTART